MSTKSATAVGAVSSVSVGRLLSDLGDLVSSLVAEIILVVVLLSLEVLTTGFTTAELL